MAFHAKMLFNWGCQQKPGRGHQQTPAVTRREGSIPEAVLQCEGLGQEQAHVQCSSVQRSRVTQRCRVVVACHLLAQHSGALLGAMPKS